jgi:hypothetical protein
MVGRKIGNFELKKHVERTFESENLELSEKIGKKRYVCINKKQNIEIFSCYIERERERDWKNMEKGEKERKCSMYTQHNK